MATIINRRPGMHGWLTIAVWVAAATFGVVFTEGCCSTRCCPTHCVEWCEKQCPETASTFTIAFMENEKDKTCLAGNCVCANPQKVIAGSGDTIRFANASTALLTIEPFSGVFDSDAAFDLEPGETVEKTIKSTEAFAKGAVLPIAVKVHSPGNECEGYPGPSIEWD